MNDELRRFLDKALAGGFEDWGTLFEQIVQVRGTLPDGQWPDEALAALLDSSQALAQQAGIHLAKESRWNLLHSRVPALAESGDSSVRQALAEALAAPPRSEFAHLAGRLLEDESSYVRRAILPLAFASPAQVETLTRMLADDEDWHVRQDIAKGLADKPLREVFTPLLDALGNDGDSDVQRACADALERQLNRVGRLPATITLPRVPTLRVAHERASKLPRHRVPKLMAFLDERMRVEVDVDQLRDFGTLLTERSQLAQLDRAYHVDDPVAALIRIVQGPSPRAALLLGDSGTGKTAVVHEAIHRLAAIDGEQWHVLRMTPSEFLSGTKYLGEWETKLRELIKAIRAPRKVVLYIPNLEELIWVGRSSSSQANVATALAPHIERGDIIIVGETTEESFRTGLGGDPSLRRLFQTIKLKPTGAVETRDILFDVARHAKLPLAEDFLDRLLELADFHRTDAAQPGRAVELLRRVLAEPRDGHRPVNEQDVLAAIRRSTGMPTHLLDDRIPLDRKELREFFEARIMGQPEAVDAAVDIVTLVKAGLTDPNKPLGVMLFVGPTGVGKTEMARTLAELCFGDPARMHRLDMSEFASYEAYERLIGQHGRPGLLTSLVKEQPFSILLLDEIEKAHVNVYDLCLQIFDAGRLTDSQGRTADFRRTIIILTSNVGSAIADRPAIGFNPEERKASIETNAGRELSRVFRPEFLNRLDRIVHFRALGEEVADQIARREVAQVLERSGIRRRRLNIDIDAAIYPLLLKEGYSRTFGARPLKRTVERLVLLPLARTIAEGKLAAGALLRLVLRGGRVHVEVSRTEESDATPEVVHEPATAVSLRERVSAFADKLAQLREQASPLSALKSSLVARTAADNFWQNPKEAQAVCLQLHRCEAVQERLEQLWKATRQLQETTVRPTTDQRELARLEDKLEELESRAAFVAVLVATRDADRLGDAVVTCTLVAAEGKGLHSVERLARMYQKLAHRYRFEVEVLDDRQAPGAGNDAISLLVSGVGAYLLLANEAGLHQMQRRKGGQKDAKHYERETVRVDVGLVPPEDEAIVRTDVRAEFRPLREVSGRLLKLPKHEVQLLHLPSMVTVKAWTAHDQAKVVERLAPLLATRIDAVRTADRPAASEMPIVRRYRLGQSQLVKDARTGRRSGRVEEILGGRLDAFLVPQSE